MKLRTVSLILVVLIVAIGCGRKKYLMICGTPSKANTIVIPSKVIELKRIGIADTITASVFGKIFTKRLEKKDTLIENFAYANVLFRNRELNSVIGTTTDSNGEYHITLSACKYDLEVQFIGYNNLIIKNIDIGTGDIINFSAEIGPGNGVSIYNRNKDGSLEKTNK